LNPWWWVVGGAGLLLAGGRAAVVASGAAAFTRQLQEALAGSGLSLQAQQLVVAHAALESGWGASKPAQQGYNLFNVTRTRSDTRPVIESGDLECDAQGVCRPITQRFARYSGLAEALAEYFALLRGPRYAAAYARLLAGDSVGFVSRLREGGYFTLPLAQYQERFAGVLAGVRKRWAQ
jgi:flagellum-specific peptidoglycan hydrolase FlgJ